MGRTAYYPRPALRIIARVIEIYKMMIAKTHTVRDVVHRSTSHFLDAWSLRMDAGLLQGTQPQTRDPAHLRATSTPSPEASFLLAIKPGNVADAGKSVIVNSSLALGFWDSTLNILNNPKTSKKTA